MNEQEHARSIFMKWPFHWQGIGESISEILKSQAMHVSYVMDGAAGLMWSFVCTFIEIEITELRGTITHVAEERSTTNLSIFCYREWHL